jgi:HAD superfamily hydrolase (TIGR01450 family)
VPVSALVRNYELFLLDLDGCVWIGDEVTERAVDAVAALRAGGKRVAFVTNDTRQSAEDKVRKLWELGFVASIEEMITGGAAVQHVLAESPLKPRTAYVVGSDALWRHVADAGLRVVNGTDMATRAEVVVFAGHDDFDFEELAGATNAVLRGAHLIATCRDPTFPRDDGLAPGTGALLAALETATGATAEIVGKPHAQIFRTALDRLGAGRALVIGDRLDSDIAGARAAGLDGALVLSGGTSREEALASRDPKPVAVAATLAELVLGP